MFIFWRGEQKISYYSLGVILIDNAIPLASVLKMEPILLNPDGRNKVDTVLLKSLVTSLQTSIQRSDFDIVVNESTVQGGSTVVGTVRFKHQSPQYSTLPVKLTLQGFEFAMVNRRKRSHHHHTITRHMLNSIPTMCFGMKVNTRSFLTRISPWYPVRLPLWHLSFPLTCPGK